MNRLTSTIVLLLLGVVACFAQELKIGSVVPDPMDLTAQKEMRNDLNGIPCALVKVRLTLPGAVFSGNVVGDVDNHTGEYYVYMTDGTKELRIKQERVKPLSIYFPDHQIPCLQSGVTYIVDISVPETLWMAPLAPRKEVYNYLLLRVEPADAKVFVDGQERSVLAGESSVLLNEGEHTVRVEASGYLTAEETVIITDRKLEKSITLKSTKAVLTVNSATPGAEILLNGRSVGTGQWSGSIMPDTYIIELRKAGFRSAEQRVTLTRNQTETINFPALEAIMGDLDISSAPSGATVSLDGRVIGTTPDIFRSIPVGTHTVRLTLNGYLPYQAEVKIAESSLASIAVTMSKGLARGHSKAAHLDLATEKDGRYVYFSEAEWLRLSESEQSTYNKKGIVIKKLLIAPAFILALTDNGKDVTWDNAMASGVNMPSKKQGEAIVADYESVKKALESFGGTGYTGASQWFWTKESGGASNAWLVGMNGGTVFDINKTDPTRVRAVAPVPEAEAM